MTIGWPRGLATKFNLLAIALVMLTALGIAWFVVSQVRLHSYRSLVNHGRLVAAMVAQNSEYGIYTENTTALLQIIDSLAVDADIVAVAIFTKEHRVLVSKTLHTTAPGLSRSSLQASLAGSGFLERNVENPQDGRVYIHIVAPVVSQVAEDNVNMFARPGISTTQPQVIGYVQIGLTQTGLQRQIQHVLLSTLFFTCLVVLIGVALTFILSRRITSPLKHLALVARDISEGNLEHPLTNCQGNDEVSGLAQAFQHMVSRLRDYRAQVAAHHRLLEATVEQRTHALQEALQSANELAHQAAEASRAKSQFLANMSHEIRTPMNGVLGTTELLRLTTLTERQCLLVDTIERSGTALLSIISDILDFSKIEAGKLTLEQIEFDLQQVIAEVLDLFAESAQRKGLELLCHLAHTVPDVVRGDPARLRQIVTNLLSNAVKFTDQGEIVLRLHVEEDATETMRMRLEVCDTGIGIAPSAQEHIFHAFTQADGSTTRQYGGTGLGLAIVQQLVTMMGGTVGVRSAPGQGATFWCTFALRKSPTVRAFSPEPSTVLQDVRVLIVDDNATNRGILQDWLDYWGMPHASTASGDEALCTLQEGVAHNQPYTLAIVDMQMPGMDGVTLARRIQAEPLLHGMHLIMLTPSGFHDDGCTLRQVGIQFSLSKPVRPAHLYAYLCAVCEGDTSTPVLATPASLTVLESFQGQVLLVEDNLVNQEVARSMIESFGCEVTVAADGLEALNALVQSYYDMIFMDCQMPRMSGFEATQAIRQGEAAAVGTAHHVPIVAITAHATAEDRARCLAVGMDDYLSKPFTLEQLQDMLKRWLPPSAQTTSTASVTSPSASDVPHAPSRAIDCKALDAIRALQRPGAPNILARVLTTYCTNTPELLAALRQAVVQENSTAISQTAHSLKSSSANVGAHHLAALSKDMELVGKTQATATAAVLLSAIEAEYAAVHQALQQELATADQAAHVS